MIDPPRGATAAICVVAYRLPSGAWVFAAADPSSVEQSLTTEDHDPGAAFLRLHTECQRRRR